MSRLYYEDEAVRVYHGDCRVILPVLQEDLELAEPAVLVTDPPYGVQLSSIKGDRDTSVRDWLLDFWLPRPALVFGTLRTRPAGVRQMLVWDKTSGFGLSGTPWLHAFEEIYVCGDGWKPKGLASSVIRSLPPTHGGRGVHPTEKPVGLMAALIEQCPEGLIVDPFMGSGPTLRAAKELGRRAIGIELEERYCRVAAGRLAQAALPAPDREATEQLPLEAR